MRCFDCSLSLSMNRCRLFRMRYTNRRRIQAVAMYSRTPAVRPQPMGTGRKKLTIMTAVMHSVKCRIMLDNMDDAMIRSMLSIIEGQAETEASGNMTQERIAALATSGLDYVSMGSLTHSVTVLDLSMLFERGGC